MKKYPEGHFVSKWMAIGVAIFAGAGVAIGTSTGNSGMIGIGPALGVAVGLAVGQSIENKYKKKGLIRPLTKKERKRKQLAVLIGLILLVLGVLAFLMFYFLR